MKLMRALAVNNRTASLPCTMIETYRKTDKEALILLFRLHVPKHFHESEEEGFIQFLDVIDYYYIFRENDVIIGCGGFALGDDGPGTARLCWYMVHPEQHKKGIGKQLVQHCVESIENIGGIHLIVARTAQSAFLFYQKLGFNLIFTTPNYWAPGFDLYHMEQTI